MVILETFTNPEKHKELILQLSTDRILTTHVGSLPRPSGVLDLLGREDRGELVDQTILETILFEAVTKIVREQVAAGIDIVCDGEISKMSYHIYAKHRLKGLANTKGKGVPGRSLPKDIQEFPEMISEPLGGGGTELLQSVICNGPVIYSNHGPLNRDIINLKHAKQVVDPVDTFMNSVSPGCLVNYVPNTYYTSRDDYRDALVEAMRVEYNAIYKAGFVLQLDCPDLAGSRHTDHQDWTDHEFLREVEKSIEALNEATSDIPPESMRLHICWLNYAGPHIHDIPISKLISSLCSARPQGLLFEGANPRHEHEWEDWASALIPDDKVLIPGVIDSTNNFIEHPVLIAQRICRYADIVGRERVLASTDCGFSTYAGRRAVFPSIVFGKLKSLSEGAHIATKRLWN